MGCCHFNNRGIILSNPYETDNYPGKFGITYVTFDANVYVYRIWLTGHKRMDALMFEQELTDWLFMEIGDDFYMGNQFTDPYYPKIDKMLVEGLGGNSFLMFRSKEDALKFENNFKVIGSCQG